MAKVLVTESNLRDIATAIREKAASSDRYKPREMASAIRALKGGMDFNTLAEEVTDYPHGNVETTFSLSAFNWAVDFNPRYKVISEFDVADTATFTSTAGLLNEEDRGYEV